MSLEGDLMPLNCNCYEGCWGDHAIKKGWKSIGSTKEDIDHIYRLAVKMLPYGTYVRTSPNQLYVETNDHFFTLNQARIEERKNPNLYLTVN
jgi:hypothetical protein